MRVSTTDQNPGAQHDALAATGCEQIFIDKASGKLATRPELDKALLVANRPGDKLVVKKLDRLGRTLPPDRTVQGPADPGAWTWWCSTRVSTPRLRLAACSSRSSAPSLNSSTP
jgi:hypothetical protein